MLHFQAVVFAFYIPSQEGWVRQTVKDLYAYIKHYPRPFLIGIVSLAISSAAATQSPRIVGEAVNAFNNGTMTMAKIWLYMLVLLGIMAVSAIALVAVRRTLQGASWDIQFDMRHDIFNHFTKLSPTYYDNNRVGDMMARMTADLNAMRMFVGVGVFHGFFTLFMMLFSLYRMFNLNVGLTLLTLMIIPMITISFFLLLRIVHRRYQKVQEQFSDVAAKAQENFSGIRVVKGFGIEERELEHFKALNDEFIRRNLSLTKVDGPLFPMVEVMFGITISILILAGGRLVIGLGGELSIGGFIDFVLLFQGMQWPLIGMGFVANIFQRGVTSWGRLKEILDAEPDIIDNEYTDHSLTSIKGQIEFQNVTLKFDEFVALENVSFKLRAGDNLGITGHTGSGKTMIANLLARVIEPTEGTILMDGIDIKRYPLKVLRAHLGIVPQEPFLFSDTIAENIAFGLPKDTPQLFDKVKNVANIVQLADDVEDFPEGYETRMGERGVTLSGGQRQRTAMARAIILEPALLILDDALSAVDTQTEASILEGLKQVAKGRSTIIIGHRISGFQNTDNILVLDQGRIVEQGSHQDLVALDGWYADMDRRQQLEESLEAA